jgi:hypothetical protein
MAKLHFPDIAADDLPDAEAIVEACEALAAGGEPEGLSDLLSKMGAPVLDMVVTPLSARAALLAADGGRAFFHHELRERVPVPADQAPEIAVWEAGTVPTWQDGVLEEPKYFSFFQDQPFPAFNPNHRRKWRPHELLHGALKFFWHPEMTRFEMYVGARINELLPVVHWYGFDEIFRPRCQHHEEKLRQGEVIYREYCQRCEDAAKPYWETEKSWRDERRELAVRWAQKGLDHFSEEWQACRAEIATGAVHEADHPRLDASSDAIGYMRSHWNRMTAWSFGVWAETFLKDGVDYFSSLERYAKNLETTTRDLLSGELAVDPAEYEIQRGRRAVQDVAYRIYVALGWLEESDPNLREAEERLMPALEQAAHHVHHVADEDQLADYSDDVVVDLLEAFARVRDLFPDEIARSVPALGYTWGQSERWIAAGRGLLEEGVAQALPLAAELLEDQLAELVADFAGSETFRSHGRLATRFARWLSDPDGVDHALVDQVLAGRAAELARFEAWASESPKKDRDAELFASLPGSLDEFALRPGNTRLNETLSLETFSPMVVAQVTNDPGLAQSEGPICMARIYMRGELRLIVAGAQAVRIFDAVEEGEPRRDWVADVDPESLASLLENGFVIWLPQPA